MWLSHTLEAASAPSRSLGDHERGGHLRLHPVLGHEQDYRELTRNDAARERRPGGSPSRRFHPQYQRLRAGIWQGLRSAVERDEVEESVAVQQLGRVI